MTKFIIMLTKLFCQHNAISIIRSSHYGFVWGIALVILLLALARYRSYRRGGGRADYYEILYIRYCIERNNVYALLLQLREILHRTADSVRKMFFLHEQPKTLHLPACSGLYFQRQYLHVS